MVPKTLNVITPWQHFGLLTRRIQGVAMLFAKIAECVEPEILEISVLAVNKLCYDGVELMR